MRIVLVEWVDSNIIHGWAHKDEIRDYLAMCKTVGFLKAEDDKQITLVMGISECNATIESFTIPKGCVIRIKELRTK